MNLRFLLLASLAGFFVFAMVGNAKAGGYHRYGKAYATPMTPGGYWGAGSTYRHAPVIVYRRAPAVGYYREPAYHRHTFYGRSAAKQEHKRHALRHGRHGRYLRH